MGTSFILTSLCLKEKKYVIYFLREYDICEMYYRSSSASRGLWSLGSQHKYPLSFPLHKITIRLYLLKTVRPWPVPFLDRTLSLLLNENNSPACAGGRCCFRLDGQGNTQFWEDNTRARTNCKLGSCLREGHKRRNKTYKDSKPEGQPEGGALVRPELVRVEGDGILKERREQDTRVNSSTAKGNNSIRERFLAPLTFMKPSVNG